MFERLKCPANSSSSIIAPRTDLKKLFENSARLTNLRFRFSWKKIKVGRPLTWLCHVVPGNTSIFQKTTSSICRTGAESAWNFLTHFQTWRSSLLSALCQMTTKPGYQNRVCFGILWAAFYTSPQSTLGLPASFAGNFSTEGYASTISKPGGNADFLTTSGSLRNYRATAAWSRSPRTTWYATWATLSKNSMGDLTITKRTIDARASSE